MGYPRHIHVPPNTPGVYHCTSRCVRRAFLCGHDSETGRSFEHRKQWMEDRVIELAGIFAVAVHAYSIMSNHFHIVIETDPTMPLMWSDTETATRWLQLTNHKGAQELREWRIESLRTQPEKLKIIRERLGSLSWFMRYLKEPIARRANKEDEYTGRFWEGRFDAQALLDETAMLSTMVYVDLNPIRAGVCETPEQSPHTSIRKRFEQIDKQHQRLLPIACSIESTIFEMSFEEYATLVDWSGRQLHPGKRGAVCEETPDIITRLNLRRNQWLIQIPATESYFWRAIGSVESMCAHAQALKRRWIRGIGTARRLERSAEPVLNS